jgi:HlyD family secretion protein
MAVRKKIVLLLLLAVIAAGAAAAYVWDRTRRASGVMRLSGNIEVTDAEVSFKIPGRVERRVVDEGWPIKKGDAVAYLDDRDLKVQVEIRRAELRLAEAAEKELRASRPEEIEAAKAAWERARATWEDLKAGSREQDKAAAEAAYEQARAEFQRMETEFGRATRLREQKIISQEDFDRAESSFKVSREQLRQASEKLSLAKAGFRENQIIAADFARQQAEWEYKLVEAGPRREKHDQAMAKRDQALENLRLAELQLEYATLKSPLTGMILSKNIEDGEYVSPGTPVVTVGDLEHVWLRAYISQSDEGRVHPGQKARVTTDTYPDEVYWGHVSFVASEAEFTPKTVQTPKERVKLVYRIKIDVDENPNLRLLPGMPADAEIVME